jgi:hypothetical protein
MKGFTGTTKKKLAEFTLDLLLPFYYSGLHNCPGI